jgi:cobalt-zinc-cadmium efflux system outer membrane protein
MVYRLFAFAFGVVAASTLPVSGQSPAPTLTLDQCLEIALRDSPRVRAAVEREHSAQARINQATALPQPVLSYDSDLQPHPFQFPSAGESYLGLAQTFEYPGRRSARVAVARSEADQARNDTDMVRLELRFDVTMAFDALLLARERLVYAEQDLELARDFLEKTELKYTAGDIAEVEVIRARVEAAQAERAVRAARSLVPLARAALNVLLARPSSAPLEVSGSLAGPSPPTDLSALQQAALAGRPDVKRMEVELARIDQERRHAALTNVPDLDLGFSSHHIDGETRTWDVTLSATVPLFWWQAKKGAIAEAEARRRAATHELQQLRQQVSLDVEQAHLTALTTQAQIDAFERDILGPASRVYEMLLFSFQQGEIGGIELIDARRTLSQARQAYADALYEHDIALAALEKSVGQALGGK